MKIMEINTAIVAGTGKSGISATNLLVKHGVKVYLFDENKDRNVDDIMGKTGNAELVNVVLGELSDEALKSAQLMVISPGIPVDASFTDIVRNARPLRFFLFPVPSIRCPAGEKLHQCLRQECCDGGRPRR